MDFGIFAPQAKKISWTYFMDMWYVRKQAMDWNRLVFKILKENNGERSEPENFGDFTIEKSYFP